MLTSSTSCGLWPCTDLMNNKKIKIKLKIRFIFKGLIRFAVMIAAFGFLYLIISWFFSDF